MTVNTAITHRISAPKLGDLRDLVEATQDWARDVVVHIEPKSGSGDNFSPAVIQVTGKPLEGGEDK